MFDPLDHFTNPKNAKSNDRFTHFAVAASRLAMKDAGLGDTPETLKNPERIGAFVGTAFGGMETFERETLKLAAKPDRPKVRHTFYERHFVWKYYIVMKLWSLCKFIIFVMSSCQARF